MTPSARCQAAIDILDEFAKSNQPLDRFFKDWGRRHRYAGSKDRAYIKDLVFYIMRQRSVLAWKARSDEVRSLVFAALKSQYGMDLESIKSLCNGGTYSPEPLSEEENKSLEAIDLADVSSAPLAVRANLPEWVLEEIGALCADVDTDAVKLAERAPVDLRINTIKTDTPKLQSALLAEGIETELCRYSPYGLRLQTTEDKKERKLEQLDAFTRGWFEIQDEGSQLAALLVDAQPGQQALDLCAGAGGKSLSLAAMMGNKGQILACDISDKRLAEARKRIQRAGVRNVQCKCIDAEETTKASLGTTLGDAQFDRIVLDVPCSGSGAWRRAPDAKWRLRPDDLQKYAKIQDDLLECVADRVKPQGRLVYITCSLFSVENEQRIIQFLSNHPEYGVYGIQALWAEKFEIELVDKCYRPSPEAPVGIQFSPWTTNTDGFFVSILERKE